MHVRCLIHYVIAREIVAALFEDIQHGLCQTVSARREEVVWVPVWNISF